LRDYRVWLYAQRWVLLEPLVRLEPTRADVELVVPVTPPEPREGVCAFPGCGRPKRRHNGVLCYAHSKQRDRKGYMTPVVPMARLKCCPRCGDEYHRDPSGHPACRRCQRDRERAKRLARYRVLGVV
jgi:hypothetical protein